MMRALLLLTAVVALLTSCEPTSETVVLGKDVEGQLVLADGVELQDAFDDGFKLTAYRLHTNPGRTFLYRELSNGKVTLNQYIELDRAGDGTLSYTFGGTRGKEVGDDNDIDGHNPDVGDDNDIDAHLQDTSDPCDMRVCPDEGGTCTDATGSNCNCNGRACVLRTELSSKEELIKVH